MGQRDPVQVAHEVRKCPEVSLGQTQHQLAHLVGSKRYPGDILFFFWETHLAQPLKGRKPCSEEEVGVEMGWEGIEDEGKLSCISMLASSHCFLTI